MFVHSGEYLRVLRELLAEGGPVCCAVAFWGRGAERIFAHTQSANVICNLESGATNPHTIHSLMQRKGVKVKQCDTLHAKVVVGVESALVGSANISCNGLNLEGDELRGWDEAGILTHDAKHLEDIRKWFEKQWKTSRTITQDDLERARCRWAARRDNRVLRRGMSRRPSRHFSLDSIPLESLRDRRCFLVISREACTESAIETCRAWLHENGRELRRSDEPPCYQGWSALPWDAVLIDFWYGPNGGIQCSGLFRRLLDQEFREADGSVDQIQICEQEHELFGHPFRAIPFAQEVRDSFEEIWQAAEGNEGGRIVALDRVVEIVCR